MGPEKLNGVLIPGGWSAAGQPNDGFHQFYHMRSPKIGCSEQRTQHYVSYVFFGEGISNQSREGNQFNVCFCILVSFQI